VVDGQVDEKRLDLVLPHVIRVSFIMKTNILQNPADTGFFSIVGIVSIGTLVLDPGEPDNNGVQPTPQSDAADAELYE
jgi:hypothetical protein